MLYVKETDYCSLISTNVQIRPYIQDGGVLVFDLPKGFVLQILQFEYYFTGKGQTQFEFQFEKVLKPRFFISPGQNFWNVKYFYVNEGSKPDTVARNNAWITLYVNSELSEGIYYGTVSVLGHKV